MKTSRFSEAQKAFILKHVQTACRRRISAARRGRQATYFD